MSIGKVDFEWVGKGPIFDVCGPKFTKFGIPVGECSQFPMPFPIDDILFPSGDIRDQVAKWRSWKVCFRPQNFTGEGPQYQVQTFYPLCYGDTSSGKVCCNCPNRSRRYQPKYTRFLANFRISGGKKLLGAEWQTHPNEVCISKRWSPSTNCEISGAKPLSARDMSLRKSRLSGSKLRSHFSPFVDQSSPNLADT